jgi:hypothetical protein
MLASGVDGETTTVCSDVFALEDAPDMLVRPCFRRQRLGSATILDATHTNCLKCVGAWMTDWGASSESARVRTGTAVLSLLGCTRALWLAGLTISSVSGDLMSLMASSFTSFSCASSSICGRSATSPLNCLRRFLPRYDLSSLCHCYQRGKDLPLRDKGSAERGDPTCCWT